MITPFLVFPPQPPHPISLSLPFASMRVLLHPLTHSCLTTLASPYTGASSLKAILCYICTWSHGFLHVYTLWLVV